MKVRYVGRSFGIDGMTDGKVYDVIEVDRLSGLLRIVDDSGEDYLYSPTAPKPMAAKTPYGKYEIVEDDENESLKKAILS